MSFTCVSFVAYGVARPGGSKTIGHTREGRHFVRESGRNTAAWRRAVAQAAGAEMNGQGLLEGPLTLNCDFYLPRPKGHFGKRGLLPSAPLFPTVTPDATKLLRAVEDALQGIIFRTDAQVVAQSVRKLYGEPARCEVTVATLPPPPTQNGGEPFPSQTHETALA